MNKGLAQPVTLLVLVPVLIKWLLMKVDEGVIIGPALSYDSKKYS